MYIYDRGLSTLRPRRNEQLFIVRPSQRVDYSRYVTGSQRSNDAGNRSGGGLGGVSGVRFGRVEQQGAVIHSGTLGDGKVEVRSGERLEIEETRKGTPIGRTIVPGFIALEYKSDHAAVSKWLQFAWFELTASIPGVTNRAIFPGSLPPVGGRQRPLTIAPNQPQWIVDSESGTDPYYESVGLVHRSPQSTTIFDRPGTLIEKTIKTVFTQAKAKSGVEAVSVTFAAHFDSYLIQNNVPVYHVPWAATITFTRRELNLQKSPGYSIEGTAGPVSALPENLRTILHSGFPSYRGIQ